jgi:hypothetical protein
MYLDQELTPILSEMKEVTVKHLELITEIKNKLITSQHFDDAQRIRSLEKKLIELLELTDEMII